MTKTGIFLFSLILVASLCCMQHSYAADEDTAASVYLVFDAETGEFVTVDDEGGNGRVDQETQESIHAGTPAGTAAGDSDAGGSHGAGGTQGTTKNAPIIGIAVIGALIVGGFFVWRRRQTNAPT